MKRLRMGKRANRPPENGGQESDAFDAHCVFGALVYADDGLILAELKKAA